MAQARAEMADNAALAETIMALSNVIALIQVFDPLVEDQPFNLVSYMGN